MKQALKLASSVLMLLGSLPAFARGGGVMQSDRCVVEMGFMQAHLTIYQPRTQGSDKFCNTSPIPSSRCSSWVI